MHVGHLVPRSRSRADVAVGTEQVGRVPLFDLDESAVVGTVRRADPTVAFVGGLDHAADVQEAKFGAGYLALGE